MIRVATQVALSFALATIAVVGGYWIGRAHHGPLDKRQVTTAQPDFSAGAEWCQHSTTSVYAYVDQHGYIRVRRGTDPRCKP